MDEHKSTESRYPRLLKNIRIRETERDIIKESIFQDFIRKIEFVRL